MLRTYLQRNKQDLAQVRLFPLGTILINLATVARLAARGGRTEDPAGVLRLGPR